MIKIPRPRKRVTLLLELHVSAVFCTAILWFSADMPGTKPMSQHFLVFGSLIVLVMLSIVTGGALGYTDWPNQIALCIWTIAVGYVLGGLLLSDALFFLAMSESPSTFMVEAWSLIIVACIALARIATPIVWSRYVSYKVIERLEKTHHWQGKLKLTNLFTGFEISDPSGKILFVPYLAPANWKVLGIHEAHKPIVSTDEELPSWGPPRARVISEDACAAIMNRHLWRQSHST